ncbi:16S rRNA (guanine(527)-N(7))-methyltransferase RsmG [Granulicella sp. dw_53]|uniref:16S rRNA (guanine(527)-N(7))-methyltransferase RsmG n=1 Tax=Granulicella sp. dw_53 TaxID=2719792 RepID=UPI001BD2BE4E|nr:16S rRNA (guanine(527)-N(7))-methyltransferase RsmG [Granulicella sp. dw_53]
MATLSEATIADLLAPYLGDAGTPLLYAQLSGYLDLLLKWNARTNLTAIRDPEEIVQRHFGESLFAGRHLGSCATLLDFGSGAGFPGLPIQLLRPEIVVTLAESQNKKVSFLREMVRTLALKTEVWGDRVESMPSERRFDVVCLRAVDNMEVALPAATARVAAGGERALLTTEFLAPEGGRILKLPRSASGVLHLQMFHVEQSI